MLSGSKRITPSRRGFLTSTGIGLAASTLQGPGKSAPQDIQGFDETNPGHIQDRIWQPISDRKVKVGIVGYGVCQFGAKFGFQNHPNVEIVAVSDLFPDRCAELAKACNCTRSYPSLDQLLKDDSIEAVFLATDAPIIPNMRLPA